MYILQSKDILLIEAKLQTFALKQNNAQHFRLVFLLYHENMVTKKYLLTNSSNVLHFMGNCSMFIVSNFLLQHW